ncbi:MAG: MBL fold metallo-hydrolase [Geminicoccaceae bacterium]|nr:MBL fold metallo-hydrolase [Geminicoccaceae bacterium]MCS7267495.1 MBL fold metallo-hydrolase [Geminicoccaceae bacterium]MDW8123699.1 MBL fold metallo-hydrolase [Geminicoccaceae bacterium]MDW8342022.1 MBL fold metallo-hydrolase [Geminicoccaceae bacterium]
MAIRIGFHGGVSTTTGACFLVEHGAGRLLVDCGLFSGTRTVRSLNRRALPFAPARLDCVLLTHAHLDHAGLLPRLVAEGLRAPIMATEATLELLRALLPEVAHALATETARLGRRLRRRGGPEVAPIYGEAEVRACLERIEACDFGRWFEPAPGVRARFWNAAHIPGSASIELEIDEGTSRPARLLFSGDLGPEAASSDPDPRAPRDVDYLVAESLYGDRRRGEKSAAERRRRFVRELAEALEGGGLAFLPVLGLERSCELFLLLLEAVRDGALPPVPVRFVCRHGTRVLHALASCRASAFGAEDLAELLARSSVLACCDPETEDAGALSGPAVLLAPLGTAEAGFSRRALRELLWRPEVTVLFGGHLPYGSLGQVVLSGEKRLRIDGEEVAVRARIRALESVCGHADGEELVRWIAARRPVRKAIFLVRGSECATTALRAALAAEGFDPLAILVPRLDERFELASDRPPRPLPGPTRLDPRFAAVAADWHNAHARLLLDIADELRVLPDDRSRLELLGRLRRTLRS